MKHGFIGLVVGLLVAAAVFAIAGKGNQGIPKTTTTSGVTGRYQVVHVDGGGGYAIFVDTSTGATWRTSSGVDTWKRVHFTNETTGQPEPVPH